jgi:hypothetical protein
MYICQKIWALLITIQTLHKFGIHTYRVEDMEFMVLKIRKKYDLIL